MGLKDSLKDSLKAFKNSITGVEKSTNEVKKAAIGLNNSVSSYFYGKKKEGIFSTFGKKLSNIGQRISNVFAAVNKPKAISQEYSSLTRKKSNYFEGDMKKNKPEAKDDVNVVKSTTSSFMGKSNPMDADLTMPNSKNSQQNLVAIDKQQRQMTIKEVLQNNPRFKKQMQELASGLTNRNTRGKQMLQQKQQQLQKGKQSVNNKKSNNRQGPGV